MKPPKSFKFVHYEFDYRDFTANFRYQGIDDTIFNEKIQFATPFTDQPLLEYSQTLDQDLLFRALFLCFILIGTSYYKSHPTPEITCDLPAESIDPWQANFFNHVYQEGLSQFAFENHLKRSDLAHFHPFPAKILSKNHQDFSSKTPDFPLKTTKISQNSRKVPQVLSLQSGGKDSLLTTTLLSKNHVPYTAWYLASSNSYPDVLNHLPSHPSLQITHRYLDIANLKKSGGLNGHVPVTYIVQSLALVQAILNGQTYILTSIGQEGNEPHAYIDDLPVNHQWSKTWEAEQLFAGYIHRYLTLSSSGITSDDTILHLGSPLRAHTELSIAEQFAKFCWQTYGHSFSSCNEANYRQNTDNHALKWCGHCAKCANAYLLFAPFVPAPELQSLFGGKDLFADPTLIHFFKGLLGIDGVIKPFECVGEIPELRRAYHLRQPGFSPLPFSVPTSNFNYHHQYPMQPALNFNRLPHSS